MSSVEVVVGAQFGSEGKGAIAAWRAAQIYRQGRPLLAIRVAGPNAGHTVIGSQGVDTSDTVAPNLCEHVGDVSAQRDGPGWSEGRFAWRLRQVPVAAVTNPAASLAIAAGSEIDPDVLANEVACLDAAGYNVSARLVIDRTVTLIHGRHKAAESGSDTVMPDGFVSEPLTARIGSTGKGIGAARMDRLARVPDMCLRDHPQAWEFVHDFASTGNVADLAAGMMGASGDGVVQVEGTQGYGLGLHAGFYPFCTSSDCRAIDFLAMAGINPWYGSGALTVWVCVRPYPIRVGGNSGPLAAETSWEKLGLPVEHTTVTGKVRRVGQWDGELVRAAIRANGGPGGSVKVALTMFDSVAPQIAGHRTFDGLTASQAYEARKKLTWYDNGIGQEVSVIGTGPDTVIDLDAPVRRFTSADFAATPTAATPSAGG